MRSLHARVQAADVASSPTWCAIAEARGEKIVMSAPRSRCSLSWFFSIVSRISSSPMRPGDGTGRLESFSLATCLSRNC